MPSKRQFSSMLAGLAHFSGQLLGVALAILVSHLIARRFGTSPSADAFFFGRRIATSLIETLNQVMGVFYIPLVAAAALRSAGRFWGVTLRHVGIAALVGAAITVLIAASSATITHLLASDFSGEALDLARQTLTVFGAALPATMACIVFAAFLNVTGRFGTPSFIRQLPRAMIAATLAFATGNIALQGAVAFTAGWYLVTAVMLVMCLAVLRGWTPDAGHEERKEESPRSFAYGTAAILLVLGALASTWLETAFAAASGSGGVTKLELSQRLGTLIGNTLATGLSLVVFSIWSRRAVASDVPTAEEFWRATAIGFLALVPIQCYFFVNSAAVVEVLLAHGAFGPRDSAEVADILSWMTLAPLSSFVLRMMLVRVLVDPREPTVRLISIGIAADVAAKFLLFWLLTQDFGVAGIVVAQAISPLVSIALLFMLTRRRAPFVGPLRLGQSRGLLVAVALGIAGMVAGALLGSHAGIFAAEHIGMLTVDRMAALCALAVSGTLGLGLFLLLFRLLRVPLTLH